MKTVTNFWNKSSSFEKAVLGLLAAFTLFCLGCFSSRLYHGSRCAVYRLKLAKGDSYILDVRTGEVQPLSDVRQTGSIRFPHQAAQTARYCSNHTSGLDSDFLVLSPTEGATVCCAVLNGQTIAPNGQIIIKRLNEELDCWELVVR